MPSSPRAVHRTILVFDIEGFGDARRTNDHQIAVREGMYRTIKQAFHAVDVDWAECRHEDRGDGLFVLVAPEIAKEIFVDVFPVALVDAIEEHNATHSEPARMRLRMSLHAGEVNYDAYGVTASALNLAFRLIDAPAARTALAESAGVLVLIASQWYFDEVIRHCAAANPGRYREATVTVKETTVTARILTPDPHAQPGPAEPGESPRQLPASPRYFTGRASELADLSEAVRSETGRRAMVIMSICGMGGVGKTWLVLHWAHQNRYRFPDGQLYVNLRGYDPSGTPVTPTMAVRGFLDALQIPPGSIPVSPEAQAALYRNLVATKRMLIVLDNARDTEQVVPLLPGGSTCTVLVTSRHQLAGLVTTHGAQPLPLRELDREDARKLLARRLGPDRIDAEPDAVEELLDHCAGLPLALSIIAAHASVHPAFRLADLVGELTRTSDRLSAFDGGDLGTNLRAVLSWSYRTLGPQEATAFRLLGVAPGPDIGATAAAALIGRTSAAPALLALERAHLVQQHAPGRYRMHDLVRLYAVESTSDSSEAEHTALRRLIDYYVHASYAAERRLYPHRKPIDLSDPPKGFPVVAFGDDADILDWFRAEHQCLLAAQSAAAKLGWHPWVWQLAWTLHGYLWRRGHLHDQLATWRAGLAAAEELEDVHVRALAHRLLGQASARAAMHREATSHLQNAITLAQQANDVHGEARAYYDLATAWRPIDDAQAVEHAGRALELFRRLDNPVWEAEALSAVGWHQARLGRYPAAVESCEQALALFTSNGNRQGQATTLDCLGYVAHHTGEYTVALTHYRDSLALCRDLGATYDEADTLDHLGQAHAALHQRAEALKAWQQALELNRAQHRSADVHRIERQMAELRDQHR
ncbi:MAG TPA: tetratricopeptide repeat protein [Actinophytocola sp.]|nr:tetratricopeptide repeat protein [Actinophytocola sp.]